MVLHHPTAAGERYPLADALRGLALLGIILANVPAAPSLKADAYLLIDSGPANAVMNGLKQILIQTKFLTLFSVLFGFGFYMQLNRAAQKGIPFRQYFFRRMLLLFGIGCLHAYGLWCGDILRYYALCGMALLLFQQVSTKRLLGWAIAFMVPLTAVVFILNGLLDLQQYPYDYSLPERIYAVEDYSAYLRYNWTIDSLVNFVQDAPLTLVSCFGKILLGYWLGRIGFFAQPFHHRDLLRKWVGWGLTAGLAGSIGYWAVMDGRLELDLPLLWLPFFIAAGLILHSLLYVAGFVRWFHRPQGERLLRLFVPIGRMALTNYLMQTLFYLLFFYRWPQAFYLAGRISLAETYLLAIGFYGLQLTFSHAWLKHFNQGPVEYFWKKLSCPRVFRRPDVRTLSAQEAVKGGSEDGGRR